MRGSSEGTKLVAASWSSRKQQHYPRVSVGENHAVKSEIPRSIPRVFPLIRHRDDVVVGEVAPSRIAAGFPFFRRRRLVALEPTRDIVIIELQAPAHSRQRLPHHHRFFVVRSFIPDVARHNIVGFTASIGLRLCEGLAEIYCPAWSVAGKPEPNLGSLSSSDRDAMPAGHLRPASFGIDRRRATDDVVVDPILGVGRRSGTAKDFRDVRLVVAKQKRRRPARGIRASDKLPCAELLVLGDDDRVRFVGNFANRSFGNGVIPRPSVAEPGRWQDVEFGWIWPCVARGDPKSTHHPVPP